MITIKDISTKELLRTMRRRVCSQYHYEYPNFIQSGEKLLVGCRLTTGGISQAVYSTRKELLGELATRPHVPSKAESKVIRRLMSKTGQSEEWLRQHHKYGQEIVGAQYPNRKLVSAEWAKANCSYYDSMFGKLFKVV